MLLAHKPHKVLVVGASGTGKTTFFLRYLANVRARWRFVFDGEGELAARLGIRPACWPDDMAADLIRTGWCIYDPAEQFPGRTSDAFAYFAGWTFTMAGRLPGRKILAADELQKLTTPWPAGLPPELATVMETGRRHGLDCAFVSQAPNLLHNRIRNQITELVCFQLIDPRAVEWVALAGLDADRVRALRPGQWVARNLRSGATAAGRVF